MATTLRNQTSKKLILLVAALAILAIFAAACGSDGDSASENPAQTSPTSQAPASAEGNTASQTDAEQGQVAPPQTNQPDAQPAAETTDAAVGPAQPTSAPIDSDLPDVTLQRVSTGEELVLSSLAPSNRPLLLWFWAPH